MDLIEAQVQAAKLSKEKGVKAYINNFADGECVVEEHPAKDTNNILGIYVNGAQVKNLETEIENLSTFEEPKQKKKVESKTVKKVPAKKVATKKPAAQKKSAPVKKSPAKTESVKKEKTLVRGNNIALTSDQWKKVDALLEKNDQSWSSFVKELVIKKIG